MNLYITQDRIGTPTGGGAVTYHEYKALSELDKDTHPVDNARIPVGHDPFANDQSFCRLVKDAPDVKMAAFYAGCFTETVSALRARAKISYTAAAHNIDESRHEFEELGMPNHFPTHLTIPELWKRYVLGYQMADLVICPSNVSKKCMESYGCTNVQVIPHGCELPETVMPLPNTFTVGYLGQAGPDKGLRYLFEAWKKLGYKDATLLIAGNNIDQALPLWRKFGGGNIRFLGFVKSVSDLYNQVSLYVQPSVTEGFGIEILEAMAHARPVLASTGAGAHEVMQNGGHSFAPRDVTGLADYIDFYRKNPDRVVVDGVHGREVAKVHTWANVRAQYQAAWRNLLA